MRFSKTQGCFYPESEKYANLPDDLITVPQEDYDNAMNRGPGDTLDVVDGRVVVIPKPAPTANELKAAAWGKIKAKRDRLQLEGGVKVGGHWFLSTERATGEYNSLINASQGMPDNTVLRSGWRTMDGDGVDMTPALARQILVAGITQRCAIDDAALAHKVAMEASADPSAYDFSGDWPDVYAAAAAA